MTDADLRALIVTPQVTLVGWMEFDAKAAKQRTGWETDIGGGEALAEFAGRACYQSWSKPNPATATNFGYLGHIIEVGHGSVLEHGVASVYLTGVSRGYTHEIVRHRHTSKSQLSQRYVDQIESNDDTGSSFTYGVVIPPAYRHDDWKTDLTLRAYWEAIAFYGALVKRSLLEGQKPKAAREAARSVLPNCAETRIVVTSNFLAWRELIAQRATIHADAEMREVTIMIAKVLKEKFPNVFQDMLICRDAGTDVEVVEFFPGHDQ